MAVCGTVARITTGWTKKLVDEVGSTVFNRNLCWVFATGGTITKADLSENFTIFHCRMSTIQPPWPVCTSSECWYTRCWHFCSCSSHKTIPSPKEFGHLWLPLLLASLNSLYVLHGSASKLKMIIVIRKKELTGLLGVSKF